MIASAQACIHVTDAIFELIGSYRLNTADGLFALSLAMARTVQLQCETALERETMIGALAQIVLNEANSLDQAKLAAGATIAQAQAA